MQSTAHRKLAQIFALSSIVILTSCASLTSLRGKTDPPPPSIDPTFVACSSFAPISTSEAELQILSEDTLRQIKEHNRAWVKLCRKDKR